MVKAPVVFAGPSVPPEDRVGYSDLNFLPPAEAGDVLKLLADPPRSICIIDGYFGDRMAVLHKEILHALSLGVRVYGAASIGALRAAELETYGMIGIGKVFRSYRDGACIRDDAVAVTHGPAETGYAQVTLAHVDIVATVESLSRRRRITRTEGNAVLQVSEGLHFSRRTWTEICRVLKQPHLQEMLRSAHVQQKRLDAIEAVRRVRDDHLKGKTGLKTGLRPPATPSYKQQIDRFCPGIA